MRAFEDMVVELVVCWRHLSCISKSFMSQDELCGNFGEFARSLCTGTIAACCQFGWLCLQVVKQTMQGLGCADRC